MVWPDLQRQQLSVRTADLQRLRRLLLGSDGEETTNTQWSQVTGANDVALST